MVLRFAPQLSNIGKENKNRTWRDFHFAALGMRTPRTPRDGAKRDRLPKIGEESAGPAGAGVEEGDSASAAGAQGAECDDDEWERLDLNGSGLEDTPRKAAPAEPPAAGGEPSPGEDGACRDPDADAGAAASPAAAAAGGDDEAAAAAGRAASAPAAAAASAVVHGSEEGPAETAADSGDGPESASAETDGHGDQQELGKRIKTLKDYVDGSTRSPRGAELDQITVGALDSPRPCPLLAY